MTEKEVLVLSDKQIVPTDEYIFSIIGEKSILWNAIMNYLSENHKDISGTWNYYNDGKRWLFKVVRKKKTIFWATVLEETFKITFYFGDKAEIMIVNSDIPQSVKDSFLNGKRYGKIRAISLEMNDLSDVEIVKKVVGIKIKMK
jgi:hypothetical protein